MTTTKYVRPLLSRLIAPFAVAIVAWLAAHSIPLPADFAARLGDLGTDLAYALLLASTGIVHKLIDRRANPKDDAK